MAIRIFDVLNFSNGKNPAADSGIQLQRELIEALLRKRTDLFFYIPVAREMLPSLAQLRQNHVRLIPCDLLARQEGGAYHFNVRELSRLLNLKEVDVDVLFVNQPELTAGLLEFFNKIHFFDIHAFNYIHWMDWKRRDNTKNRWNLPGSLSVLTSILLSTVTGCNSRYGKTKILREAAKWFNPITLAEMEKRLVVLWPGINAREILRARTGKHHPMKTLIFPFRAQRYTGFKSLIETHLANLWERRRDFRVVLTNPSDYNYIKRYPQRFPFVEVRRLDRLAYLRELWMADIVVGCHNGASQWSIAAVEAMAAACVPLLNSECFFPEMLLEALPPREHAHARERYLYYRVSFSSKLEHLLDNLDEERERAKILGRRIREFYAWETRIPDWLRCFEATDAEGGAILQRTPVIRKIERLLRSNRKCSKALILQHLGWHERSRQISWTKYRRYLRERFGENARSPVVTFEDHGRAWRRTRSRLHGRLIGSETALS